MDIITLALAKKYADEKLTNIDGSSTQSDWNQNDETAVDYIKNRPFYTADPAETSLVDESALSTWYEYDDNAIATKIEYNDISEISTYAAAPSVLVLDQTYKVTWDGTEYDLVCFSDDDTGYYCLGGTVSNFEEYSFSIANNAKNLYVYIPASEGTSASHTLKIAIETIEDIPIDEKYIPDTIARKTDLDHIYNNYATSRNLTLHTSSFTYNGFTYHANYDVYAYFLTEDGLWKIESWYHFDMGTYRLIYDSSTGTFTSYLVEYVDGSAVLTAMPYIYAYLYDINTGSIIKGETYVSSVTVGEYTKCCGNFNFYVDSKIISLSNVHNFDLPLPTVTTADNGKILQVVDGVWTAVEIANGSEVTF